MENELPEFDVLVRLHEQDPEAFERYRRKMLRQAVDTAPARHRAALEELLEVIEIRRARAGSPIEAAATAFQMMRQSVSQLQDAWRIGLKAASQAQTEALLLRLRLR
jgi:hypothetical protein